MVAASLLLMMFILLNSGLLHIGLEGVSGKRAEDKKRLYPVKVDATEASDATASSIVQKDEQATLSTEEDPTSKSEIPKEEADASSKSTQQSMGRNSELRPHPFIGQSLMIDDSIAEKIISNAAHAFMHPRKPAPKVTPRRQILGVRGTLTDNDSDWQYASDGPDQQPDEDQDSNLGFKEDSLPIGRALSEAPSKDYWATVWKDVKVCDDTCPENSDGFCQDGREADGKAVLCDLGTDCTDCGPWVYKLDSSIQSSPPKPIATLRAEGVPILVDKTKSVPDFLMPYSNHLKDVDVSEQVHRQKIYETGLSMAQHVAMRGRCVVDGQRSLVMDIGANFGWYSFYAAAHGCRVIAWEPVPRFRQFLIYGQHLNHHEALIQIRDKIVSDIGGQEFSMAVPFHGTWGTASINSMNIAGGVPDPNRTYIQAVSERADSLAQEDVLLAKIDVEGFEPQAMRSLKGIFDQHRVRNIFMEYSPGVYEIAERWTEAYEFPDMLAFMLNLDYQLGHLDDTNYKGKALLQSDQWDDELPPLPFINKAMISYDLVDTFKFTQRTQTDCWIKALRDIGSQWSQCLTRPEDLNPKSFRSGFGYNTNLWATLDLDNFQSDDSIGFGLARKMCSFINAEFKVKSHCSCPLTQQRCSEEVAIVSDTKSQGPMTFGQKKLLEAGLLYLTQYRGSASRGAKLKYSHEG